MKKIFTLASCATIGLGSIFTSSLTSCSTDDPVISKITISGKETVAIGEKTTYVADVEAQGGASTNVKWSIVSPRQHRWATIDPDTGEFQANPNFETQVTIKAESVFDTTKFDTFVVNVKKGIQKITIIGSESVIINSTSQYSAEVEALEGYDKTVKWSIKESSTDARIDPETGVLTTGKEQGTITVCATSIVDERYSKTLEVEIYSLIKSIELLNDDILTFNQNCFCDAKALDREGKPVPCTLICDVGTSGATWDSETKILTTGAQEGVVEMTVIPAGYEELAQTFEIHICEEIFNCDYDDARGEATINGLLNKELGIHTVGIPATIKHNNVDYKVTKIGEDAFYDWSGTNVNVHLDSAENLIEIGEAAFLFCSGMKQIHLTASVTKIGISCFDSVGATELIIDPNSNLTEVGSRAFESAHIKSLDLSNITKLNCLSYKMCDLCYQLEEVIIPECVNEIQGQVFGLCYALSEIRYLGTMEQWGNITKAEDWNQRVPATVVHCSDGDVPIK